MSATYTPLGLTKHETGDLIDTWGPMLNEDKDTLDDLLGGILDLALTANKTLTSTDGEPNESTHRNIVVSSSTGDYTVTLPASMPFTRTVQNDTANDITFTVSGGTNTLTVPPRSRCTIRTDATECYPAPENTGWFLVDEHTSFSGDTVTLDIKETLFREWRLEYADVSHDGAGSDNLNFQVGPSGFQRAFTVHTPNGTATMWGSIEFRRINDQSDSYVEAVSKYTTTDPASNFRTMTVAHYICEEDEIDEAKLTLVAEDFDSGSCRLYGR